MTPDELFIHRTFELARLSIGSVSPNPRVGCVIVLSLIHIYLDNYVLKPLFSFSGSGVIFNVTEQDILAIPEAERKNFMLQRKVHYQPCLLYTSWLRIF